MALLHYFHLLYQHTLALAADSTTSTPSNKLKILVDLVALLTYKYRSHAIGTRRRDDLKEPKGAVPFFEHMLLMASVHQRKEITQLLTVKLFREYASEALNVEAQKVVDHLDKAAASGT
ncbi:hypothetical protein BGZ90_006611, partial [Linnemannia elongata]